MSALKICPQCGTEYELDQRFCPTDGSTLKTQGGGTGDLVGSIIADRYHVMRKLGEGGMGTVYLAEHVKEGRKSAVNGIQPLLGTPGGISRFNREAANASRIITITSPPIRTSARPSEASLPRDGVHRRSALTKSFMNRGR